MQRFIGFLSAAVVVLGAGFAWHMPAAPQGTTAGHGPSGGGRGAAQDPGGTGQFEGAFGGGSAIGGGGVGIHDGVVIIPTPNDD